MNEFARAFVPYPVRLTLRLRLSWQVVEGVRDERPVDRTARPTPPPLFRASKSMMAASERFMTLLSG